MSDEYEFKVTIDSFGECDRNQCSNDSGKDDYCSKECWMADNPNKAL